MRFCVFSYNRGRFLRNCVDSIERCVARPSITIFDDDSDDPETRAVLSELAARYTVFSAPAGNTGGYKCGGLYGNMQAALDRAEVDDLLCFVQDDTQLVRTLEDSDRDAIVRFFARNRGAGFLHPGFFRASNRKRDLRSTHFDQQSGCYYRRGEGQSAGLHFSAISICHVGRLRDVGWVFLPREKDNDRQAATHFSPMGYMRDPFVAWLPQVPAYRGKTKTVALRVAERWRGCGFHPIAPMSAAASTAFRQREESVHPVAEDFLSLREGALPAPWLAYPLQGSALLKLCNRIELGLRRWLGALRGRFSASSQAG